MIVGITFFILLLSLIGLSQVSFNNYLLNQISKKSQLRRDYEFFENNYNGIRTFEMGIHVGKNYSFSDIEVLNEMIKIEDYLNKQQEFNLFLAPITIINRTFYAGQNFKPRTLFEKNDSVLIRKQIENISNYTGHKEFRTISKDLSKGRIIGFTKDIGRNKISELLQKMDIWISQHIDNDIITIQHTGYSYIQDIRDELMTKNMFINLAIAIISIAIFITLLYKKLSLLVLVIIPNIIPLLLVAAVLAMLKINLDSSISIVFTIGFVIAVDDTIHFINKYSIETNKLKPVDKAL